VHEFLVSECGVKPRYIIRRMHLTVYHARRTMAGVIPSSEPANLILPVNETRFMVMAPGGENPKPELEPARRTVGIRVNRRSTALPVILDYRTKLLRYETQQVLGKRAPSSSKTNAFGARHFQPHMAMLRAGSDINRDLKLIGRPFRQALGELMFDRFVVDVARRLIDSDRTKSPGQD